MFKMAFYLNLLQQVNHVFFEALIACFCYKSVISYSSWRFTVAADSFCIIACDAWARLVSRQREKIAKVAVKILRSISIDLHANPAM